MSDNDTSEINSSDFVDTSFESVFNDTTRYSYIMLALTLAALVHGGTSWRVIKKFRNYTNYLFLNANFCKLFIIFCITK